VRTSTRKVLDRSFSGLSLFSVLVMAASLLIILGPLFVRGAGALVFKATVEHRKVLRDLFQQGDPKALDDEIREVEAIRKPAFDLLLAFEDDLRAMEPARRRVFLTPVKEVRTALRDLFGPLPGETKRMLVRDHFGEPRWDRARVDKLAKLLYREEYDYSDPTRAGVKVLRPRVETFRRTALEPLFPYVEAHLAEMLLPRWTVYWGFLTNVSHDAHFFGGIWPELVGTFYLTLGAMVFAIPMGVIAAI